MPSTSSRYAGAQLKDALFFCMQVGRLSTLGKSPASSDRSRVQVCTRRATEKPWTRSATSVKLSQAAPPICSHPPYWCAATASFYPPPLPVSPPLCNSLLSLPVPSSSYPLLSLSCIPHCMQHALAPLVVVQSGAAGSPSVSTTSRACTPSTKACWTVLTSCAGAEHRIPCHRRLAPTMQAVFWQALKDQSCCRCTGTRPCKAMELLGHSCTPLCAAHWRLPCWMLPAT